MENIGFVEGSVCPEEVTVLGENVYIAKNIEQVEKVQDDIHYVVYQYQLRVYTKAEYEAITKQDEILEAVNASNEEIANSAVDAYTLELMEAGVL